MAGESLPTQRCGFGCFACLVCTTTAADLAGLLCCPKLNAISWPFSRGLLEMPSLFDSSNAPRKNKICLSVEDLLGSVLLPPSPFLRRMTILRFSFNHRVRQAGAGGWSWSGVREKYYYMAGG